MVPKMYPLGIFNMRENPPFGFIDDFPMSTFIYRPFPIATHNLTGA